MQLKQHPVLKQYPVKTSFSFILKKNTFTQHCYFFKWPELTPFFGEGKNSKKPEAAALVISVLLGI